MLPSLRKTLRWIIEWKFGIFLFLNSLVFVFLFYNDINKRSGFGSREIIGDITFKYNKIQRKFDNQVVWEDLDTNSPLSNRDSVRSDISSQATILLKDGTEIQMDEESMVILEINDEAKKINFLKGSINVKKNKVIGDSTGNVLVDSQNGSVKVKDGDVIVAKQNPKAMDVSVARGEAEVSMNGQTLTIKKNQKLSANENGMTTKNVEVKISSALDRAKGIEKMKLQKYYQSIDIPVDEMTPVSSLPNSNTAPKPIESAQTNNASNTISPIATKKNAVNPNENKSSYEQSKINPPVAKENPPSKSNTKKPSVKNTKPQIEETDEVRHKKEKEAFERFMKM
jgi:hypothetical protein